MVVNFDGPGGIVIVDDIWLTTGEGKSKNGKWLYITSNVDVFVENPDVSYPHLQRSEVYRSLPAAVR